MTNSSSSNGEICELCKRRKDLQQSHIIPRFIGDWLKKTSGTGFLRSGEEPNLRVQDTKKIPLLCEDCEQRFSSFESYFAKEIFYPFQNEGIKDFSYNENLLKFIVSISWRVLTSQKEGLDKEVPDLIKDVEKAERVWRKYLMNSREDTSKFEHHLFFLDYLDLENTDTEISPYFSFYTLRSIDATFGIGEKTIFVYTKLPGIIIVSSIYPRQMEEWIDTKIERKEGKISPPQKINDPEFGGFLNSRAELLEHDISEKQEKNIAQTVKKNPEKFVKSRSFESLLQKRSIKTHL